MRSYRIIVFGTGRFLEQKISEVNMEYVTAFSDNDPEKWQTELYGKSVINPLQIPDFNYDYIVIFSPKHKSQIVQQLTTELNVSEDKIISWEYFLNCQYYNGDIFDEGSLRKAIDLIQGMKLTDILDIDSAFARFGVFTKNSGGIYHLDNLNLDCLLLSRDNPGQIYYNIYDQIYTDTKQCISKEYEAILMTDLFMKYTVEECSKLIENTYHMSRYVILTVPYPYSLRFTRWHDYDFGKYGKLISFRYDNNMMVLLDKTLSSDLSELQIYVAAHKPFILPENPVYYPIHAGKLGKEDLGFPGDDSGNNISELNPLINECTALYWIWKHAACRYIGLNHYRRYFLRNSYWYDIENVVDFDTVDYILTKHDIILADPVCTSPNTVSEYLEMSISEDAYQQGNAIIREIIAEKQPDYLNNYDMLMQGYSFYPCNMFITRKEILDQYCEWLFSIIIEAAQKIDVSGYDAYSKRVVGFFAERLLTVWLMKQKLKIKELTILVTE